MRCLRETGDAYVFNLSSSSSWALGREALNGLIVGPNSRFAYAYFIYSNEDHVTTAAHELVHEPIEFFVARYPGVYRARRRAGEIVAVEEMFSVGLWAPSRLKIR
jgi:hypothetical protein